MIIIRWIFWINVLIRFFEAGFKALFFDNKLQIVLQKMYIVQLNLSYSLKKLRSISKIFEYPPKLINFVFNFEIILFKLNFDLEKYLNWLLLFIILIFY